jgi:hypothetical protein
LNWATWKLDLTLVHSKHKFRIINPFFFTSTGQQQTGYYQSPYPTNHN